MSPLDVVLCTQLIAEGRTLVSDDSAGEFPFTDERSMEIAVRLSAVGPKAFTEAVISAFDHDAFPVRAREVLRSMIAQLEAALSHIATLEIQQKALRGKREAAAEQQKTLLSACEAVMEQIDPCIRDYVMCPITDGSWFEGTVTEIGGPSQNPLYYVIKVERVSEPPPVLDNGPVVVGGCVTDATPKLIRNIMVVYRWMDPAGPWAHRDKSVSAAETIGGALAVLRRLDYGVIDGDVRESVTRARSTLSVALSKIRERIDG